MTLCSKKELAHTMGVHTRTVDRWMEDQPIRWIQIAGTIRFDMDQIKEDFTRGPSCAVADR